MSTTLSETDNIDIKRVYKNWTGRAFVDTANGENCGHGDFRRIIRQQPKAGTPGGKSMMGRKHYSRVLREQIIGEVRGGRSVASVARDYEPSLRW